MPNSKFIALSRYQADLFRSDFTRLSKELFYDSQSLQHPAEFGAYRERACANFLKLFLPTYLTVGAGFLINKDEGISTQCDLVIFDPTYTPLMEDMENNRFFPVETVAAIGEIKSELSKHQLLDALVKLAEIKQLKTVDGDMTAVRRFSDLPPTYGHHFDYLVSFLICSKFSFKTNDITADISKHYDSARVPIRFRHNLVLSIEDGILCYKNHLLQRNVGWMYPEVHGKRMKNRFISPGENKWNHFGFFTAEIFRLCASSTIYLPQIGDYDTPQSIGIYQDEN